MSDDRIAIPKWPALARQFASACEPEIDRVLQDIEAAEARAVAAQLALGVGVIFEKLYELVGQDGAAAVFERLAGCARSGVFGRRQ